MRAFLLRCNTVKTFLLYASNILASKSCQYFLFDELGAQS